MIKNILKVLMIAIGFFIWIVILIPFLVISAKFKFILILSVVLFNLFYYIMHLRNSNPFEGNEENNKIKKILWRKFIIYIVVNILYSLTGDESILVYCMALDFSSMTTSIILGTIERQMLLNNIKKLKEERNNVERLEL